MPLLLQDAPVSASGKVAVERWAALATAPATARAPCRQGPTVEGDALVQGLGFRVEGLGFRVWGWGFRV